MDDFVQMRPVDPTRAPAGYIGDLAAWAVVSAKLEFAKYFERDHPFVVEAAVALGLLPEQLDDMWAWAAA